MDKIQELTRKYIKGLRTHTIPELPENTLITVYGLSHTLRNVLWEIDPDASGILVWHVPEYLVEETYMYNWQIAIEDGDCNDIDGYYNKTQEVLHTIADHLETGRLKIVEHEEVSGCYYIKEV